MNKGWDELTAKQDIPAECNAADMNKMKFAAGTFTMLLSLNPKPVNNFKKGTGNAIILNCLSRLNTRHKDFFVSY